MLHHQKFFFSRPCLSTYFIKREHQKFRVNGRKWSLCYNTFGIYSEYSSFGAKAKSFNPCPEAAFERRFTMSSSLCRVYVLEKIRFMPLQLPWNWVLVLWVVLHVTFWILTSPIDRPKSLNSMDCGIVHTFSNTSCASRHELFQDIMLPPEPSFRMDILNRIRLKQQELPQASEATHVKRLLLWFPEGRLFHS